MNEMLIEVELTIGTPSSEAITLTAPNGQQVELREGDSWVVTPDGGIEINGK